MWREYFSETFKPPWTTLTVEVVILIYFFSFLFVFGTSILQFGFGADLNFHTCSAATLFCLGARLKSKLYLLNSFGMLGMAILNSKLHL
ncbi:hypothetical protein Ct61P_07943 [Colletotrichum tofieldiae]|nr:hypothetical protein Ct61P_07943 [Colletotrichum tofieldiae]